MTRRTKSRRTKTRSSRRTRRSSRRTRRASKRTGKAKKLTGLESYTLDSITKNHRYHPNQERYVPTPYH